MHLRVALLVYNTSFIGVGNKTRVPPLPYRYHTVTIPLPLDRNKIRMISLPDTK